MKYRTILSLIVLIASVVAIGMASAATPAVAQDIAIGQWMPAGSTPTCTCPRCGFKWQLPYAVRAYDQFGNVTYRWTYEYAPLISSPVISAPRYRYEYEFHPRPQTYLRELPHVVPAK